MIRFFLVLIFLIIFFIITIPIVLIDLIIGLFNRHARDVLAFACLKIAFRFIMLITGVKLDVYGKNNIPKDTAVLYIGNHNSFFDVLTGYYAVPGLTGFIAKKELGKVPGLNWWMYLVNCLFLDRDDPRAGLSTILSAVESIKHGVSIFVFPEGTRSKDGTMGEFKEGTFKIATKTNCPIIPVAFMGTADAFENHFPKITASHITITFGEPIYPGELSRKEQKCLGSMTKARIQEILDAQM